MFKYSKLWVQAFMIIYKKEGLIAAYRVMVTFRKERHTEELKQLITILRSV